MGEENYYILCIAQKIGLEQSIMISSIVFKNGSNLMNAENSKTNELHRFRLTLGEELNVNDPTKNMALANLSIYYTRKNIKSAYKNNKFKISAPTWNDDFDLPDGSYSILDIQDYFE